MDATNAITAIELIREAVGLSRRATAHEIVCEVRRRLIPPRRLMDALAMRDDVEEAQVKDVPGPEPEPVVVREIEREPVARAVPVPKREPVRKVAVVVPRAPVVLPSLTRGPEVNQDRLKMIREMGERMRRGA